MKPLQIDFAEKSLAWEMANTSPGAWIGCALAASLFSFAALESARCIGLLEQQTREKHILQRQSSEVPAVAAPPTLAPVSTAQAGAVNRAVAQLNLPWRDLLDALEEATPPELALLALESHAQAHLLKGVAEARRLEDMLAYLDRLKRQDLFHAVTLTRHEVNERETGKPIRFHFEVRWKAAP